VVFSTDSRTVQHQDSEDGSGGNCKFQIYSPLLILSVSQSRGMRGGCRRGYNVSTSAGCGGGSSKASQNR